MDWTLFRSQHDGTRCTARGCGAAKNFAQIVDANGARDGVAGVGGDQRIEVNQRAILDNEADAETRLVQRPFARRGRMDQNLGKSRLAYDLARIVDSRRKGPQSCSGHRAKIGPDAATVQSCVGGAIDPNQTDDLAGTINGKRT